jgi:hypothetical protein
VPLYADNSPNIKWPLPAPYKPFKKNNVLSERSFNTLKEILTAYPWGPGSEAKYHTISGRWTCNPEIPKFIEEELLSIAKESWKEPNLKQNFIFAARYQKQGDTVPYLWRHLDDTSSQYLMDLCVVKSGISDWGVEIEGTVYSEEENSAVFFNGQQHIHGRPPYPPEADDDAYIIVFFAIYAKPGDWAYDLDSNTVDKDSFRVLAKEYTHDAEIRFYEATGKPISFEGLPAKNRECVDCPECYSPPLDFPKNIEGYVPII